MVRLRLRWKILLYSSALLVALIGATLVYVSHQAGQFVDSRIAQDLERGRQRIQAAENERLEDLKLIAQLVASQSNLKALLDTRDSATIRDWLLSYQEDNHRPDLLVVLDPHGGTMARTDIPEPVPVLDVDARWVRPAIENRVATGVMTASSGVFNAAVVPADAGGIVFGFVLAGSRIDHEFARSLRDVTQNEVAILSDDILGSTLPAAKLPWRSGQTWQTMLGQGQQRRVIEIEGERYIAAAVPLISGGEALPLAVVLQSRDRALAPYRRIQLGLLLLGLAAAVAGILASAMLARSVTAPVAKLVEGTEQVASGNFDFRIDVQTGDEIGDLAQSFNSMIQGLRERRDMQKFVSQTTVDMIQSRFVMKGSVGMRKLLTVFFSDMRGFTAMSEQLAPEEVVKILSACLGLQTERVKKYDGDVDKFVGDCVMALFSGDDGALRAIQCATEIHQAIEGYNASQAEAQPIAVGIGIVTGEVVLGSIGGKDRLDFTVIGSNVNLCARLCALAGSGETLLAESTYQIVQDQIAAELLDPQHVKGFSQAVAVYRVSSI